MQLRFLTSMAGATNRNVGDVAEVAEPEAGRLVAAGYAVPVVEEKQERAVPKRPAAEKRG